MYDRGVLDLLQMAQEGAYSDVEADDFVQSKKKTYPKQEPQKRTEPPAPTPPVPRPATPVSAMPQVRPPKSHPAPVPERVAQEESIGEVVETPALSSNKVDLVVSILESATDNPLTVGQIATAAREIGEEFDPKDAIATGISMGIINKTGQRRATRYSVGDAPKEAMTEEEYDGLWKELTSDLRKAQIEYRDLMAIVVNVTGHTSAIDAFKSGELTKDHIAE